jgi:hypothetical protein
MLARVRSLSAVYSQNWSEVVNFVALDPMYEQMDPKPPAKGVNLRPWPELVPAEHQNVLRWYSMMDAWKYGEYKKFGYGDDTTYISGMAFLDGHGTIEDWGCGFAHAKAFVRAISTSASTAVRASPIASWISPRGGRRLTASSCAMCSSTTPLGDRFSAMRSRRSPDAWCWSCSRRMRRRRA